jgi:single-strand DNA-binding protein
MNDLNQIMLIGRLTKDAELRYTASNMALCKFRVASTQRSKKDNAWVDEPFFIDVALWGKSAEAVHKYLVKGKQVAVAGQLREDHWEKDGQARSRWEINANNVQLLGGGSSGGSSSQAPQGPSAGGPSEAAFEQPAEPAGAESFEDDIPF